MLAVAGAVTAYYEIRPFFVSGPSIEEKLAALTLRDLEPGPSELSHRSVLDDCYRSLDSIAARASPPAAWQHLLQRCEDLAVGMTAAGPANSYAWLVGAVVAAEKGEVDELNRKLLASQATAPSEGWLAQLRVRLAEEHLQSLDEAAQTAHRSDLELLVFSNRGLPDLVSRYLEDPAFRSRMTRIVEDMPAAAQSRFIAAVRRAGKVSS